MSIRRRNVLQASSFKRLTALGGAFALLFAPTLARAEGGSFTLTFTQARPIADASGWCGETENYVRIYKVLDNDTGQYDPNWLAESDYMRVHDCTFGGASCTPDPRPIDPPIFCERAA